MKDHKLYDPKNGEKVMKLYRSPEDCGSKELMERVFRVWPGGKDAGTFRQLKPILKDMGVIHVELIDRDFRWLYHVPTSTITATALPGEWVQNSLNT